MVEVRGMSLESGWNSFHPFYLTVIIQYKKSTVLGLEHKGQVNGDLNGDLIWEIFQVVLVSLTLTHSSFRPTLSGRISERMKPPTFSTTSPNHTPSPLWIPLSPLGVGVWFLWLGWSLWVVLRIWGNWDRLKLSQEYDWPDLTNEISSHNHPLSPSPDLSPVWSIKRNRCFIPMGNKEIFYLKPLIQKCCNVQ